MVESENGLCKICFRTEDRSRIAPGGPPFLRSIIVEMFGGNVALIHDQPTRYSPTGKSFSLLDLIITNKPVRTEPFKICPPISDHCPVIVDFTQSIQYPRQLRTQSSLVYDYSRANWQALTDHLSNLPLLQTIHSKDTIDSAWSSWQEMVENAVAHHIPCKSRSFFPSNKPWFNATHHRLRRHRDRLFAAAKRLDSPEAWSAYRLARNCFVAAIRRAKRHFLKECHRTL